MGKEEPTEKDFNVVVVKKGAKPVEKEPINRAKLGPDYVAPDGGHGWFVALAAGCSNVSLMLLIVADWLVGPISGKFCAWLVINNKLRHSKRFLIVFVMIVVNNKNHKDTAWEQSTTTNDDG